MKNMPSQGRTAHRSRPEIGLLALYGLMALLLVASMTVGMTMAGAAGVLTTSSSLSDPLARG